MEDKQERGAADTQHLDPRKRPGQPRSALTVDAIVEGAAQLLERHGFEGYTTNGIAKRAGVSIGSLYQYFPGKDSITIALIERELATLCGEVAAARGADDWRDALRAMIGAAVRHQARRPDLARLLDFEESRLTARKITSAASAVILDLVAELMRERPLLPGETPLVVAGDVVAITRGIADGPDGIGAESLDTLQARIERAVFGYLDAPLHPPTM